MNIISVEKYREDIIGSLAKLVSIRSVRSEAKEGMPYGEGCARALDAAMQLAKAMGFEAENLGGHLLRVSYGQGEETLAVLSHLDVVPEGEGWSFDPYSLTKADGRLYGRGTIDDKGGAVASLYALKAVKDAGIALNRRIELLFGCDEESGWGDIDYFKAHYPDPDYMITPDAGFPMINREKGLLHMKLTLDNEGGEVISLKAGTRPNIVPNKAYAVIKGDKAPDAAGMPVTVNLTGKAGEIEVIGKASHGSHPEGGINAAAYLIRMLAKENLPGAGLTAIDRLIGLEYDGKTLGIAAEDELVGALTLNLGTVSLNEGRLELMLDIRTPIKTDLDELFERVSGIFAGYGFTAQREHCQPSHYVPEESFIVQRLKAAYRAAFDEECVCLPCAGATYARAFETGIAFGPCDINAERGEHGPDEFIYESELIELTKALALAMVYVCTDEKPDGK